MRRPGLETLFYDEHAGRPRASKPPNFFLDDIAYLPDIVATR